MQPEKPVARGGAVSSLPAVADRDARGAVAASRATANFFLADAFAPVFCILALFPLTAKDKFLRRGLLKDALKKRTEQQLFVWQT